MPQQRCAGSVTSTPFFSSTATAALPVRGSLYSTEQVAKRAHRGPARARPRAGCGLPPVEPARERLAVEGAAGRAAAWMPTASP